MKIVSDLFSRILWFGGAMTAGSVMLITSSWLYLTPSLPSVESLRNPSLQMPLRIYTKDGLLIGEFGEKRRKPISYDDVPPLLIQAILAAEDSRFYLHPGIDTRGLFRAFIELLLSGSIQSGGSTITMQVARNYFLDKQRTISRKLNEILLALKIENELSKQEIMSLYINKIYLGKRAYGFAAAAEVYYGKSLKELQTAQLAMLAGLPKAPSRYNPVINPQRAKKRRDWILQRMESLDFIDKTVQTNEKNREITARYHHAKMDLHAPYAAEMARAETIRKLGISAYVNGVQVFTTIDGALQKAARRATINGVHAYQQRHGYRGAEEFWVEDELGAGILGEPEQTIAPTQSEQIANWRQKLAKVNAISEWKPAVITEVRNRSCVALLQDGSTTVLEWNQGLRQARRYININTAGRAPVTASDVVQVGDLVRLIKDKQRRWQLGQIPKVQGSLVALSPRNGAVRAIVGGSSFQLGKFNHVTQAKRQTGSVFKPFIYSAALSNGLTAASILNDAPVVFDDEQLEMTWRPENSSGDFLGPITLRKALYRSRNLVSIRLLRHIGITKAVRHAEKFGLKRNTLPNDLSLALGSHVMTPMEVARSYSVFANSGYLVDPYIVDRIEDKAGSLIYQYAPKLAPSQRELTEFTANQEAAQQNHALEIAVVPDERQIVNELSQSPAFANNAELTAKKNPANGLNGDIDNNAKGIVVSQESTPSNWLERVIDPRDAFIIDSMLRNVITRGTGRLALKLKRGDISGKTGTTNGPTDAWFAGYHPSITAVAWIGFDDNSPLGNREYGGSAALPIWVEFMNEALKKQPIRAHIQPPGVVSVRINPNTGERASSIEKNSIFEFFKEENQPKELSEDALRDAERATNTAKSSETIYEELF